MEALDPDRLAASLANELARTVIGDRVKKAVEECLPQRYGGSEVQRAVESHIRSAVDAYIHVEFREQIEKRVRELLTPLIVDQAVQAVIGQMVSKLYK